MRRVRVVKAELVMMLVEDENGQFPDPQGQFEAMNADWWDHADTQPVANQKVEEWETLEDDFAMEWVAEMNKDDADEPDYEPMRLYDPEGEDFTAMRAHFFKDAGMWVWQVCLHMDGVEEVVQNGVNDLGIHAIRDLNRMLEKMDMMKQDGMVEIEAKNQGRTWRVELLDKSGR
jgi:hypothetical protein